MIMHLVVQPASSLLLPTFQAPWDRRALIECEAVATVQDKFLAFAIKNVSRFGDTDIFPFPLENHIFHDLPEKVIGALKDLDANFDTRLESTPPLSVKSLAGAGYFGFRTATLIDPLWNAYLLALVASIGQDIESARIPTGKKTVFSYRFAPDFEKGSIFDSKVGWQQYQKESLRRAHEFDVVLSCDIADFYPRIYHHRLENALKKATANSDVIARIMKILSALSNNVSYGLPVGGPAARLLSELLLNRTDRYLTAESVVFCRFVDDFRVFAKSREQAFAHLLKISKILSETEGLSLQRNKTRIMVGQEFAATSSFSDDAKPSDVEKLGVQGFLQLHVHYDPYSPNRIEEYRRLRKELGKFDIVGMLAREIRKPRIDESTTRRLIKALKYLSGEAVEGAVLSMMDSLDVLYPVFPTIMLVIRDRLPTIGAEAQSSVFKKLREMIKTGSYITSVPINLSYALRVLSDDPSEESEAVLTAVYQQPVDIAIKRDIILIMANRNADYWVSDIKRTYSTQSAWEQRSLVVASYILEDEGRFWRNSIKGGLRPFERVILDWAADRKQSRTSKAPI